MYSFCLNKDISSLFYYVGFFLYCLSTSLKISMLGQTNVLLLFITVFKVVSISLCVFSLLLKRKISLTYITLIFVIFTVFLIVKVNTDDHGGLLMLLVMLCAWNVSPRILSKIYIFTVGGILVINFFASKLGIVEDRVMLFYRSSTIVQERHACGFLFCNQFAGVCFFILSVILYLLNKKSLILFLCCLIFTLFVYFMTYSRLELLMMLILSLSPYLLKLFKQFSHTKIFRLLVINIFCICFVFSFAIVYLYDTNPSGYRLLNDLMTGRLELESYAISHYGFSYFGQVIEMVGAGSLEYDNDPKNYFFIDSFYINWTLVYGFVAVVFLNLLFYWIVKKLYDKNNLVLLFLLVLAFVHGIIISSILQPSLNPLFTIALADISFKFNKFNF